MKFHPPIRIDYTSPETRILLEKEISQLGNIACIVVSSCAATGTGLINDRNESFDFPGLVCGGDPVIALRVADAIQFAGLGSAAHYVRDARLCSKLSLSRKNGRVILITERVLPCK